MNVLELHQKMTEFINKGKGLMPVTKNLDDFYVENINRVIECDNEIIID